MLEFRGTSGVSFWWLAQRSMLLRANHLSILGNNWNDSTRNRTHYGSLSIVFSSIFIIDQSWEFEQGWTNVVLTWEIWLIKLILSETVWLNWCKLTEFLNEINFLFSEWRDLNDWRKHFDSARWLWEVDWRDKQLF